MNVLTKIGRLVAIDESLNTLVDPKTVVRVMRKQPDKDDWWITTSIVDGGENWVFTLVDVHAHRIADMLLRETP